MLDIYEIYNKKYYENKTVAVKCLKNNIDNRFKQIIISIFLSKTKIQNNPKMKIFKIKFEFIL